MMDQTAPSCPIGSTTLNEQGVRVTAALVSLLALTFLVKPHWAIAAFLSIDFFLRAFDRSRFSVLARLSSLLLKMWPLPPRKVNARPKQFAAMIGFVMSDLMFVLLMLGAARGAQGLAFVLLTFALLEAVFRFCAGCHLYPFLRHFLQSKQNENLASLVD